MKVQHYTDTPAEPAEVPGVTVRWVIKESDGAPHFAMRVFEVEPGGASPFHTHWWEHEVFVLSGRGHVKSAEGTHPIREGTVVFVGPDEEHQFVNEGEDVLRFLCLIPHPSLEGWAASAQP